MAVWIAAMFLTSGMVVLAQDSEPNDDFWSANYCYDGDTHEGNVDYNDDPSDYYQIFLWSDDVLTATLTTSMLDMELYDSSQDWVDDSRSNDLGQPHIEYTAITTGYHYIEVTSYAPNVDYVLEILVNDQPSGGGLWVGGEPENEPVAEVPEMTVGNGVYWGGVKDIGEEFEQELEEGLQEIEDMGFDVSYDISGGVGAYFGIEVASDSADVDGITCYDVAITGALAVNLGLKASVDGTVSESGFEVSIDGSGDGYVELEANLEGHLYLTVDELAIAKFTLTLTAEGEGELHLDADMSMQGTSQSIKADATMDVSDVKIDFDLTFDPPLDIYQFPMWEGKQWYVPGYNTDVSGSLNAQGTVSYDVYAVVPGEEPIDDSKTVNLADEIGNNNFFETVPGGEYDYYEGGGGTIFTCAYAGGDIFIIETGLGDVFGYMDYGTRQGIPDVESMVPSTGLQYNGQTGMITGMTMDGEVMTETVTPEEVDAFAEDPLKEVTSETGGRSSGLDGGLLGIILIGVIVIVVVVVVVILFTRKTPPSQQYPPQQYGQQPPPPPPEYQPPADQYQQPQQDQYQQQPPPPPPPGY